MLQDSVQSSERYADKAILCLEVAADDVCPSTEHQTTELPVDKNRMKIPRPHLPTLELQTHDKRPTLSP